ncbi:endonuclease domain-containing protein [Streptomyces hesseae]|uniref:Endonuclease domain-containing protein n=1 Tax=Streptomyces hesseae TaxID=3075519 RepID=A0ABU2SLS9_9ACTN|nr:endonuclease domain-containing protein [Streptomyces sp. DSM 40473]MDT0449938.1 endonuclease domain-containing protein [Streptomyces sp. DSM 40473]
MWDLSWDEDQALCGLCGEWLPSKTPGRDDQRCRGCAVTQRRVWNYGLSIAGYNAIFRVQEFRCALCGECEPEALSGTERTWHIDHDHRCCTIKTGSKRCCVRGILCPECNVKRLPAYERLPEQMRDSPLFNGYLLNPPARRPEAEVIVGRDDRYMPGPGAMEWDTIADAFFGRHSEE